MMDPCREIFQEPTLLPPVGVKRPSARDWSSSSKKKAKMEAGGPSGSNPGSDGSAWSSSSKEKAKSAAGGRSGSHGISDPSAARSSTWKKEVKREAGGPPGANQVCEGSAWSSSSRKKAKIEEAAAAAGPSGSNARSDRSNGALPWKAVSGSSPCNFSVLAKIVSAMRTRHRRGDTQPLTLEEILADTQQLGIGLEQKQWLMREALVSNPQIQVLHGKYAFKPKYNLKNKKALLRLLEEHNRDGLGGILLEDIEGLPNCQKALKALGDQVVMVNCSDKKKIIFLNDKSCQFSVDEEFQKVWRSVAVGSLDDEKMEDYLKTQGFSLMQGCGPQKAPSVKGWRKPTSRRKSSVVRHNANLAGVLKDYSDTDRRSQEGTNTWSLNQKLQTP